MCPRCPPQAAEGTTLAALRARLDAWGRYECLPSRDERYGDALCLSNLFGTAAGSNEDPPPCTLLPLPLLVEPPRRRLVTVTVVYPDGRTPPTTYGVSVGRKCTVRDIAAGLHVVAPPLSVGERYVLARRRERDALGRLASLAAYNGEQSRRPVALEAAKDLEWLAFCLPEARLPRNSGAVELAVVHLVEAPADWKPGGE